MTIVILFIIYAFLSAGGLVLFKLGGQSASFSSNSSGLQLLLSWKVLLGIFCYLFSFILWLFIVSKMQLSFAMPLSVGIVNLLVLLGSAKFLNEEITPLKIAGLVVIIVGLFLISAGNSK